MALSPASDPFLSVCVSTQLVSAESSSAAETVSRWLCRDGFGPSLGLTRCPRDSPYGTHMGYRDATRCPMAQRGGPYAWFTPLAVSPSASPLLGPMSNRAKSGFAWLPGFV